MEKLARCEKKIKNFKVEGMIPFIHVLTATDETTARVVRAVPLSG